MQKRYTWLEEMNKKDEKEKKEEMHGTVLQDRDWGPIQILPRVFTLGKSVFGPRVVCSVLFDVCSLLFAVCVGVVGVVGVVVVVVVRRQQRMKIMKDIVRKIRHSMELCRSYKKKEEDARLLEV